MPQADDLTKLLHDEDQPRPHNSAFGNRAIHVPEVVGDPPTSLDTREASHARGSYVSKDLGPGAPIITLLSPIPQDLRELGREWKSKDHPLTKESLRSLYAHAASTDAPPTPVPQTRRDLRQLAEKPFTPEETRANVCSIVVLLENRGRRLLLTGDGHPHVYEPALRRLREERANEARRAGQSVEDPFVIDVVKVAHHGSSDNTSAALREYHAKNYLISTNGANTTIPTVIPARLIVDAPVTPTFYFNYPSVRVLRWARAASELGGFEVKHPPVDGMVFDLLGPEKATYMRPPT